MADVAFQGYASPNYTQVPDELFDEQLPDLTGAELKALLYIIRRTFGFKKPRDNISLNQLLHGITTKAGERLDRGTGLSRSTLVMALRGLVSKNLIIATHRTSMSRGNQATNYQLNVLSRPGSNTGRGESENRTRVVRIPDSQERDSQERDSHLRNSKGNASNPRGDGRRENARQDLPPAHTAQQSLRGNRTASPPRRSSGFTSLATALQRRLSTSGPQPAHPSAGSRSFHPPVVASQELRSCIETISEELGDREHLRSNLTQATHLLAASGLHEATFIARLFEARAITKDQQRISTLSTPGKPIRRPMPYFFRVAQDLLGPPTDESQVATQGGPPHHDASPAPNTASSSMQTRYTPSGDLANPPDELYSVLAPKISPESILGGHSTISDSHLNHASAAPDMSIEEERGDAAQAFQPDHPSRTQPVNEHRTASSAPECLLKSPFT